MGVLECHQLTPLNKMVELKNLRMSRCKFGGINISPANFTPMKKYFSHVIIAILLLFLHKYHVFALSLSSLIHIVVLKISWCNISSSKESKYRKQIAMTSDCMLNGQWSIWRVKNEKRKQVNTNNEHKKIIHKFNDLQINYLRRRWNMQKIMC